MKLPKTRDEALAKWRETNLDKAREYKKWREANSEKVRQIKAEWRKANPDKTRTTCDRPQNFTNCQSN